MRMRKHYKETGINWFQRIIPSVLEQSTGLKELDEFRKRGLGPGHFLEIDGSGGSGKTEFCMTLIAEAFRKRNNYYVYYVDYTGGFSPHRLREILKNRLDPITDEAADDYLKKVIFVNIQDESTLHYFLLNFVELTENRPISLLIIENIGLILAGTCQSMEYYSTMGKWRQNIVRALISSLSNRHAFPVVFTNHLPGWVQNMKPALGKMWALSIHHHILLSHQKGTFLLQNFDGALQPTSAIFKFRLTEKGVTDL